MIWLFIGIPGALAQTPEPTVPAQVEEAAVDPLTSIRPVLTGVPRFANVKATARDGVVSVEGSVPSEDARDELLAFLRGRPGVVFVDDRLDVDGPPPDAPASGGDAGIEAHLEGVFAEIGSLSEVDVSVRNGVVRLQGTVVEQAIRDQAVELARSQEGVVWVTDDLRTTTDLRDRLQPAADDAWAEVQHWIARLPLLLVALAVFAVGWVVARAASRWDWLTRSLSDRPLLRATVSRIVRGVILVVATLVALEILDATALVGAVVGTAGVFGLAIGFAFQDIVENYLAGFLLAIQQPFSKDDFVDVGGIMGVVVRLTARNTLLLTPDGNHVYVPNATVFKSHVTNFSRNPLRRFDFEVGVGVDEDLAAVVSTGLSALGTMPGVVAEPAPAIQIARLGDSSVVMQVFAWLDQREHDLLAVRTEAIRRIKEAYESAGFDMPEPIYRVSMTTQAVEKPAGATPSRAPTAPAAPAVDLSADTHIHRQAAEERSRETGTDLLDA